MVKTNTLEAESRNIQLGDIASLKKVSFTEARAQILEMVQALRQTRDSRERYSIDQYKIDIQDCIDKFMETKKNLLVEGFFTELRTGEVKKDMERLKIQLVDSFIGRSVLSEPFKSDKVDEIQVNEFDSVWVETGGKKILTDYKFENQEAYQAFVERLLQESGKKMNDLDVIHDAITYEGYRLNVIGPGAAVADKSGPRKGMFTTYLTVRKQPEKKFTCNELIESGTFSRGIARMMEIIPIAKTPTIIAGATGSGKTVDIQIIQDNCPDNMRIFITGNPSELRPRRRDASGRLINNVVQAEEREYLGDGTPSNMFPTPRNLNRAALRLTPDLIIKEEIRSPEEFIDFASTAETGHFGMTSLHSGTVYGVLNRYVTEYLRAASNVDRLTVMTIVAEFLKFVIIQTKMPDKSRKITEFAEIKGIKYVDGVPEFDVNMLYRFKRVGSQQSEEKSKGSVSYDFMMRKVHGYHERCGFLSKEMHDFLINNTGFTESQIEFIAKPLEPQTYKEGELDESGVRHKAGDMKYDTHGNILYVGEEDIYKMDPIFDKSNTEPEETPKNTEKPVETEVIDDSIMKPNGEINIDKLDFGGGV